MSIIIVIKCCWLLSGSPAPQMSINFENEAHMLLWSFAKLLVMIEACQYEFAAHWIWWIAALFQWDPALWYLLNHQKFPSKLQNDRGVHEPTIIGGIN